MLWAKWQHEDARRQRFVGIIVILASSQPSQIDRDLSYALSSVGLNLRPLTESVGVCRHIFRTGDVTAIDAAGALLLRETFGIRHYLDLRTDRERQRYGEAETFAAQGITTILHPVTSRDRSAIAKCRPTTDDYALYYLALLDEMAQSLLAFFECIAEMDGMPFLFGCHAGKDRTGLMAMLLLHVCAADTETIARGHERSRDYLLPHIDRFRDKWEHKKETREDYSFRLTPQAETMRHVIVNLNDAYGSLDGYLLRCGVTEYHQCAVRKGYSIYKRSEVLA